MEYQNSVALDSMTGDTFGPAGIISRKGQSHDDDIKQPCVFTNGNGLTNGHGITNGNGSTNGNGLTNGQGLANGNGLANGHGLTNGNGSTNGNGLTNGHGLTNGNGRTDGHGLANGDGLTNDLDVFTACPPSPPHQHESPLNQPSAPTTNGQSVADQNEGKQDIFLAENLPELGDEVILAPFEYLTSLPSKGIRNAAIDAINVWLKLSEEPLTLIKSVVSLLHSSSLMLDDIEDNSPLRRGRPSTHVVFGSAQTINSADYLFVNALNTIKKLDSIPCLNIFIEELRLLYIGQSFDLYWTHNVICPSVEDYLKMVDSIARNGWTLSFVDKTYGGQVPCDEVSIREPDQAYQYKASPRADCLVTQSNLGLGQLMALIGRYFQIRDDYLNLVSADYTSQKGFCEDLDEGKFSLPLIHALGNRFQNSQLRSILQERRAAGKLSFELKQVVLEHLHQSKSLEYTKSALHSLQSAIDDEIKRVEKRSGVENFVLKMMLKRLRI
ncbi:hypothetical protein MMC07_000089 [Pseudocyphellaria aurata]|nr:hypothetical protein [Pseudocyphellaria aurata]